jgi:hypothetical protein
MKTLLLVAIALMGTACVNPRGDVQVHEKLEFKRKTIFGKTKKFTVKAGTYHAKVSMSSSKKGKLKLNGVKHDIKFKLPHSISENGITKFAAGSTGQPFGMEVDVQTSVTRGERQRETQACTVTVTRRVCERVDGQRVCKKITEEVEGKKRVTYQMVYTDRDVKIELTKPASDIIVMSFQGADHDSIKDTIRESACKALRRPMNSHLKKIPWGDFN